LLGGVKRLISNGPANQASASAFPESNTQGLKEPRVMSDVPSYFATGGTAATPTSDATGALWQNFAGLNLKSGESIVINGEVVHFHSWGDSVPSVMQVLPLGVGNNLAFLRQVRAHEVWSMAREVNRESARANARESGTAGQQNPGALSNTIANTVGNTAANAAANTVANSSSAYINSRLMSHGATPLEEVVRSETNASNTIGNTDNNAEGTNPQRLSENITGTPLQSSQPYSQSYSQTSAIPSPSQPPIPEPVAPPEPTPNAWEVWTYLERQRQTTLKHLHTFRAEWEANRFVREAERSAPDHLRVHYEIRPVVKSEDEPSPAHDVPLQDVAVPSSPYPRTGGSGEAVSKDNPEVDHTDAIDVEILDS
jgi:hypothetical protein